MVTILYSLSDTTEYLHKISETDREQIYGHGERGGEGEMYGENNMETYITICKTDSQWEFAYGLGNSNRGSI